MLLTFTWSITFSGEAIAIVESTAQVSYYEPTNSIWAHGDTYADYETLLYYEVSHWGYVRKGEVPVSDLWSQADFSYNACSSEFFPYDPDADYAIEVYPTVHVIYRHSPGDTYADYYNYVQWTYANQVYAPYSFGFTGPGPDMGISFSDILLGYVFGIFTQGGTSGPPHHLQVITDSDVTRTDLCGQIEKRIQFKVVDQQHRAAGKVALDEKPQTNLTDTCSGTTPSMSTCSNSSSNTYGNFTDGLRTGCPHTGPTPCGFDLFNRWRWCRINPYTPTDRIDLAFMYYWVTRAFVKVDGDTDIPNLTYKFPLEE
jgi:hypothetical protein